MAVRPLVFSDGAQVTTPLELVTAAGLTKARQAELWSWYRDQRLEHWLSGAGYGAQSDALTKLRGERLTPAEHLNAILSILRCAPSADIPGSTKPDSPATAVPAPRAPVPRIPAPVAPSPAPRAAAPPTGAEARPVASASPPAPPRSAAEQLARHGQALIALGKAEANFEQQVTALVHELEVARNAERKQAADFTARAQLALNAGEAQFEDGTRRLYKLHLASLVPAESPPVAVSGENAEAELAAALNRLNEAVTALNSATRELEAHRAGLGVAHGILGLVFIAAVIGATTYYVTPVVAVVVSPVVFGLSIALFQLELGIDAVEAYRNWLRMAARNPKPSWWGRFARFALIVDLSPKTMPSPYWRAGTLAIFHLYAGLVFLWMVIMALAIGLQLALAAVAAFVIISVLISMARRD